MATMAAAMFVTGAGATVAPEALMVAGGITAFGQIYKSMNESQGYMAQAAMADVSAKQAEVQGLQESNVARQQLLETLAKNRAAAGAGGLDPNVGSVRNASIVSMRNSVYDISNIMTGANITAQSKRLQGAMLRKQARAAQIGGFIDATGTLLGNAWKAKQIGTVPSPTVRAT